MNAAACARCGAEINDIHITTYAVDRGVEMCDGKALLDQGLLDEPESIHLEAICQTCKHVRYLSADEWEWA